MRESSLWTWLVKGCAGLIAARALHMTRVENGVGTGMADVEGCLQGMGFWLELKCARRPVLPTTPIRVRFEEGQIPWLKRRADAGGCAYVLLQVGEGRDADVFLVAPDLLEALAAGSITLAGLKLSCLSPQTPRQVLAMAIGRRHVASILPT